MAVMEYIVVRGERDTDDAFPMQGIELDQIAHDLGIKRTNRLQLKPDDYGWEVGNEQIVQTEIVYHPALLPERIVVRAPEGGDLKVTFELAKEIGERLGANVYNQTTGQLISKNFPGESAAQEQKAKEAELAKRRGCGPSMLLMMLGMR